MSAPGSSNALGISEVTDFSKYALKVPTTQAPPEDGGPAAAYGSKTDMGALVLSLVSNWFINGETVLIDGGVRMPGCRRCFCADYIFYQTLLVHPSSY